MKNIASKVKDKVKELWKNSRKTILPLATGTGLYLATLLNPTNAYSQNQNSTKYDVSKLTNEQKLSIQRGVSKPTLKDSTDTYYIFEFRFNENLEEALKNTKKPKLFLTGDAAKESYIKFNKDTTAAELYYPKKYFNEQGIGENIGISWIHEGASIDLCNPNIPGTKTNPLSSFYWNPSRASYKQSISQKPKELEKSSEGKLEKECYEKITIIDNSITNNYYKQDTAKTKQDTAPISEPEKKLNFNIIAGINANDKFLEGNLGLGYGPVTFIANYGNAKNERINEIKTDPFPKTGRYGYGTKDNLNVRVVGISAELHPFFNKTVSPFIGAGINKWDYDEKTIEQIRGPNDGIIKENSNSISKRETSYKGNLGTNVNLGKNSKLGVNIGYDTKAKFNGGVRFTHKF